MSDDGKGWLGMHLENGAEIFRLITQEVEKAANYAGERYADLHKKNQKLEDEVRALKKQIAEAEYTKMPEFKIAAENDGQFTLHRKVFNYGYGDYRQIGTFTSRDEAKERIKHIESGVEEIDGGRT